MWGGGGVPASAKDNNADTNEMVAEPTGSLAGVCVTVCKCLHPIMAAHAELPPALNTTVSG